MKQLFALPPIVLLCIQMLNANHVPVNRLGEHKCHDAWSFSTNDCCPPLYAPDQNGRCREIWRTKTNHHCQKGYEPAPNGKCKLIRRSNNILACECPTGWQLDQNGRCREVWRKSNIIGAPKVCPEGQRYANGQCKIVH